MKRNTILIIAEILVMGGILIAFIAPLLFHAEEPDQLGFVEEKKFILIDLKSRKT